MAYRIVYGPEPEIARYPSRSGVRRLLLTGSFLLLFLFLIRTFWPDGTNVLCQLLLPGDPEVTRQALHVMMDQWEQGAGFRDSLEAFCRVVLTDAPLF